MKLNPQYNAKEFEDGIYNNWLDAKLFEANPNSPKKHYSISMPPPNETGNLHLGHALFITLQDILIRHARAKGYDALWLPGTDHAAIATNAIIEKQLAKEGTNKHKIGRKEFLRRTRLYVNENRNTINSQIKKMGASVDWSRAKYTLDPSLNRIVNEVFIKMYNDGLIYRDYRIVNWDPLLETNVSDDEVEYIEQKTKLYTFKFGPFEISTTRPETKFADKYVVMHPKDKRYQQYKHLETFETEWINGKIKATIIKDEAIDPKFGTGVMTITPWHSLVDFEIAQRHNLDKVQVIGLNGKLLEIAQEFSGLEIDNARKKIVSKLNKKGLLVNVTDNYIHNIAVNSRGKGIIEPQIRLQWFIDVNKKAFSWKGQQSSFKEVLQRVIKEGDIKIIPSNFEKVYFHWINNLRDWCISRQIWWGHRLPVWYLKEDSSKIYVGLNNPNENKDGKSWIQDPDTLDTWFSSSLWSFSTLIDKDLADNQSLDLKQLLEKSIDFRTYHPTDVLETGWDIIFFWAARMILSTTYSTNQVPFKTIYLHGLVRTEQGKKMSKSDPESIIDPVKIIEQFGTDALRLALIQNMSAGKDQKLGVSKIITNRNFCNKLWNVARFIEGKSSKFEEEEEVLLLSQADHWIISRLNKLQKNINHSLNNYLFSDAYQKAYRFLWDDLADWYIEYSKVEINSQLLNFVLRSYLILIHGLAPFISEVIWQNLYSNKKSPFLANQNYPQNLNFEDDDSRSFQTIINIISELRKISKSLNLSKVELYYEDKIIIQNRKFISKLIHVERLEQKDKNFTKLSFNGINLWLKLDQELMDQYIKELISKIEASETKINSLTERLKNKSYLTNAPKEIIDETKADLEINQAKLQALIREKDTFSRIS